MAYLNPTVETLTPAPLPRGRLLDLIPRITDAGRWLGGITWLPWPSRGLLTQDVDVCNPAPTDDIDRYCLPAVSQGVFRLIDALTGSTLEVTPATLVSSLEGRFKTMVSWAFARELLSAAVSGESALSKAAHAPTGLPFGSAATSIWNALAVFEAELSRTLFGGAGIIHMPPSMMILAQDFLIRDGDRWTTPSGHLVVFDGGYIDAPAPEGEAASAAGEEWLYASGPVAYELKGPAQVGGDADALDVEHNTFEVYMDAFGVLQFDAEPVTAVLVSYALVD